MPAMISAVVRPVRPYHIRSCRGRPRRWVTTSRSVSSADARGSSSRNPGSRSSILSAHASSPASIAVAIVNVVNAFDEEPISNSVSASTRASLPSSRTP